MNKYQVAIIGTNIGAKHYEDFQKVTDRFNVHTICGLTKESINNLIPSNSDIKVSLNFEEVLIFNEGKLVENASYLKLKETSKLFLELLDNPS